MTAVLELDDLYYSYPGQDSQALKGASLAVPAGRKLVVVGRNGCGKSTLFLHCNGILKPDRGVVRVDGVPLSYDRRSILELRRRVGIVFQSAEDQLFSASVAQDISFGPLNLGLSDAEVRTRVQAAAETCEIVDLLDRPVHALSGGQKTRLALAGVLAMDPQLLVVDEVLGNLDPWMQSQIVSVLQDLVDRGKSVLISSHDLGLARSWADVVVVMSEGRVIAADSPDRVFGDPALVSLICPADAWDWRTPRDAIPAGGDTRRDGRGTKDYGRPGKGG